MPGNPKQAPDAEVTDLAVWRDIRFAQRALARDADACIEWLRLHDPKWFEVIDLGRPEGD